MNSPLAKYNDLGFDPKLSWYTISTYNLFKPIQVSIYDKTMLCLSENRSVWYTLNYMDPTIQWLQMDTSKLNYNEWVTKNPSIILTNKTEASIGGQFVIPNITNVTGMLSASAFYLQNSFMKNGWESSVVNTPFIDERILSVANQYSSRYGLF
jgi:hypothetical protein